LREWEALEAELQRLSD
jgi:phage-related tail protein